MKGWKLQVASDIVRDGLGVELVDSAGEPVAEVFRADGAKRVFVNTFGNELPIDAIEWMLAYARDRLEPFEDGTPLPPPPQSSAR